ncbi:hypothetical protein B7P43_G01717 [Cryptotermes secundus]|uniref:Uncharacterized protein n=1 Tax=Cryptotermes secundus TaxID=105785 RepID=A0A2J7PDK0_9NEOP|nr:hypothetical protein B7P43_G01717 [Cryptotermes secundus]
MRAHLCDVNCNRLRVFENRALRRIFGLKRDEVTGGWRKLHNEELHNLYSSPSITIIFQQDGAPPHWGLHVRGFLNETFPDRWIERGGPIPWLPRSPDITPLDFFPWGYVTDIVYRTKARDITN